MKTLILFLALVTGLFAQSVSLVVTTNWVAIDAKGGLLREQGTVMTNLVVSFTNNGQPTNAVVYFWKGDTLTKEITVTTNSVTVKTDPKVEPKGR